MRIKPVLLILFLALGGVGLLSSRAVSNESAGVSEEEYIETTLRRLGYPPYASASGVFGDPVSPPRRTNGVDGEVYLPVKHFYRNQTINPFGVYRDNRFRGYHSGVDVEVDPADLARDVPVYSIYGGKVVSVEKAGGYGGVVSIRHDFGERAVGAIYGHLRLKDIKVRESQKIPSDYLIGYLGADRSGETDGERKHLHFGLYKKGGSDPVRNRARAGAPEGPMGRAVSNGADIRGYVDSEAELKDGWISPNEFLRGLGAKELPTVP